MLKPQCFTNLSYNKNLLLRHNPKIVNFVTKYLYNLFPRKRKLSQATSFDGVFPLVAFHCVTKFVK